MSNLTASLSLYVVSSILYVLSIIFGSEVLTLISKPVFIPAIVFYYFTKKSRENDDLFLSSLVFFYIAEMLFLINVTDYYLAGLLFFLLPYFILIYFLYVDFIILIKTRKFKINKSLIILSVVLLYLLYSIFGLLDFTSKYEMVYMILFGISLLIMLVFTAILFIYSSYRKNSYLAFAVLSLLMSGLFFVLYVHFLNLLIFKIAYSLLQTMFYFFYVKYFLERSTLRNRVRLLKG